MSTMRTVLTFAVSLRGSIVDHTSKTQTRTNKKTIKSTITLIKIFLMLNGKNEIEKNGKNEMEE